MLLPFLWELPPLIFSSSPVVVREVPMHSVEVVVREKSQSLLDTRQHQQLRFLFLLDPVEHLTETRVAQHLPLEQIHGTVLQQLLLRLVAETVPHTLEVVPMAEAVVEAVNLALVELVDHQLNPHSVQQHVTEMQVVQHVQQVTRQVVAVEAQVLLVLSTLLMVHRVPVETERMHSLLGLMESEVECQQLAVGIAQLPLDISQPVAAEAQMELQELVEQAVEETVERLETSTALRV
jgi:hypothetical protein